MSESTARSSDYLTPAELATEFNLPKATLKALRKTDNGPPFVRIAHKTIRYSRAAAQAWLATCRSDTRPTLPAEQAERQGSDDLPCLSVTARQGGAI